MANPPFTLDFEELRALEEEKLLLSGLVNGKRKVSAALLSPPSRQGSHSSSSSSSSAFVRIRPFEPSIEVSLELPENTESVAFLDFLGFNQEKARDIFGRWIARPDPLQNPDDLIQYALADLGRLFSQPLSDLPAAQAMAGLGISDELQEPLTDPRFSQLFQSESLHYWLTDTMKIRYSTLDKLLERLKSYAIRTVAKRKEKKRPKIAGVFESVASSSTQQLPTTTAVSSIASVGDHLPSTFVAIESEPLALPDHSIFYKGKAAGNLSTDFIFKDGRVNMRSNQTEGGGDFNQINRAWYWSKEKATAEKYRQWGEIRCSWAETWIIQIQVPKTFVDSLRKEQLWYSPDWKEYIWYCRKGTSIDDPPAKFDKFWKAGRAQLIEGHICARAPAVIPRIKKEELQERISEGDVMTIEDRKATQSVFVDEEIVKRLGVLIRGKIYIEIHPAVKVAV